MNFLQPALLLALPIAALPIIIHLINQRRYQTTRWAAMMFLLAANKMSRGYAKLRQWLILALRVLAIAGLIFAISRPLTGGWLGQAAGGKADATLILLDRSPSMQQAGPGGEGSKLETGRRRLVRTLKTVGSARWVLIDGAGRKPVELADLDDLLTISAAEPLSAPADIPAMLQAAQDYIKANKSGRTEVWICSDARADDWSADSGRWRAVRDAMLEHAGGLRVHLLGYPDLAPGNVAVRVVDARRRETNEGAELLVSLKLTREGKADGVKVVPVQFDIEGARSVVNVDLAGATADLKDHRIPIERQKAKGWGKVSIPADANPADDDAYFAFDRPAPRRAVVVAEDAQAARPLELAASIAPEASVKCSAEVVGVEGVAAVEWADVSLLLWQAALPEGDAAKRVKAFVDRGGVALFFPPRGPAEGSFLGTRWTTWAEVPGENPVIGWRGDQDLLAATQAGAALPVGGLQVRRARGLAGEFTNLATLKGGAPLLARVATDAGGVYLCTSTPAASDSSLAGGGVVLYVMVQRAMAAGAQVLGSTRALDAGPMPGAEPARWKRLAGAGDPASTDYPFSRGVYQSVDRLLAVNRPAAEDVAPVLADDRVAGLFRGLDFSRVDDTAGGDGSLINEIWRIFLVCMLVAMIAEAALCLPKIMARRAASRPMAAMRQPETAGAAR